MQNNEEQTTGEPLITATIQVSPGTDMVVIALANEIAKLLAWAALLEVLDQETLVRATEDLTLLANLKKALEESRREYTVPLNDHLKSINEVFKALAAPLEEADKVTREKIMAYRREEERKAAAAQEINRLRLEAAQHEMELEGELSGPVRTIEVPAQAPDRVRTKVGDLGTVKTKQWEVENLSLVPLDYMMIDAAKVGKQVRAGIPRIPGIRIWEEEGLRINARR